MTVSLLDLPNEILLYIARFLSNQEDISYFSRTNQHLHSVLNSYLYRYNVHYDNASALAFGAYKGYHAVVEKCLAAKPPDIDAPPDRDLNYSWKSHNALCNAIKRQHTDLVELLLDHGACPHYGYRDRVTPLLMASEYGNVESMRMLIKRGADLNAKDKSNRNALYFAVWRGKVEFIKLLLEHGAGFNSAGVYDESPLHHAARLGDFASVQALLDYGADVAAENAGGYTPLCMAARSESVPCVELLLRSGAKDQLSTAKGRMALYGAVSCGRIETAQLFLDQGVILERKEDLMHIAVWLGDLDRLDLVLRCGADVNAKYVDGETPLLRAVRYGWHEIAQRLMDAGADIHSQDKRGRTPLSLACEGADKRLEHILLGKAPCRSK